MGQLGIEFLEYGLLVGKERQLLGWNGLFLWQETRVLEEVAKDEHDERAYRGVAVIAARIDLLNTAQMLDQALSLQHKLGIGTIESRRLVNQVLMEFINHIFDLIARLLHESRVIEKVRPGGPVVGCTEVFLKQVPELESSNGPLGVNRGLDPVVEVDAHLFDDLDSVLGHVTQAEGVSARDIGNDARVLGVNGLHTLINGCKGGSDVLTEFLGEVITFVFN